MNSKFSGSCLCGQARFEVDGDFESFFLCHCQHCRKGTGSAHASNLFSTSARLTWLGGKDQVQSYTLPGTRHTRIFCGTCGSALPGMHMNGKLLMVPAGSLDSDVPIKPNAHLFMSSKANWDEALETLPKLDTLPG